ncbi:unnamed protein product [Owenia fusiformis]|uniref:aspartate transaminase n=1 Tax=Owenia fusiformis TaxID=6347 RepID=A0A8J1T4G6_OWEFU|nr:unnamed protein product [Owenia fusiformis]
MATNFFSDVDLSPPIEVFALTQAYNDDPHPNKVNLGVGAYRTDEGKPWVLPVVKTVENQMAADPTLNHEYLPIAGLTDYVNASIRLLLGADSPAIAQNRVDGCQGIGGTGCIRVGLDFLYKIIGCRVVYVSTPTWGNHKGISKAIGYDVREYRYWDNDKRGLNFEGYINDLKAAPSGAVVLLHTCAHNPTGVDPSKEQWAKLAEVIKEKHLFPFFDCAYQGFATGNLEADAWPVRYFVEQGFELLCAQSYSKNFGLYNERTGNLTFVSSSSDVCMKVKSQIKTIIRQTWSNSPNHGCRIVSTVLNNPSFYEEWSRDVKTMAERILLMRQRLHEKLKALGTPGNWDHIVKQIGMFSYTGLNPRQVDFLVKQYHIFLLKSGRINMCALTTKNLDYVANAIHEAVTEVKDDPKL